MVLVMRHQLVLAQLQECLQQAWLLRAHYAQLANFAGLHGAVLAQAGLCSHVDNAYIYTKARLRSIYSTRELA